MVALAHNQPSRRSEFLAGVKAELAIALSAAVFGAIYGVLAISAGLPPLLAQAMSFIVFAGSAQFIAADLFATATPAGIILLTTFIVNLRHTLYSASIAPYLRPLSPLWKFFLSYLLTDEAYVIAILHYQREGPGPHRHYYLLGAGLTLWTAWQGTTAIGIFLGTQIPASWGLDFSLALTFIGLVITSVKDRPGIAAALCAGLVSILAFNWPYQLGLVAAALSGILTGLWLEGRQKPEIIEVSPDEASSNKVSFDE